LLFKKLALLTTDANDSTKPTPALVTTEQHKQLGSFRYNKKASPPRPPPKSALIPILTKRQKDLRDSQKQYTLNRALTSCKACFYSGKVCSLSTSGSCNNCDGRTYVSRAGTSVPVPCRVFTPEEIAVIKKTCPPCTVSRLRTCDGKTPCNHYKKKGKQHQCNLPSIVKGRNLNTIPKGDSRECHHCSRKLTRKCDGESPCATCQKDGKTCRPQYKGSRCTRCYGAGIMCSGGPFCEGCTKHNQASCAFVSDDRTTVTRTYRVPFKHGYCEGSTHPCARCFRIPQKAKEERWCTKLVNDKTLVSKFIPAYEFFEGYEDNEYVMRVTKRPNFQFNHDKRSRGGHIHKRTDKNTATIQDDEDLDEIVFGHIEANLGPSTTSTPIAMMACTTNLLFQEEENFSLYDFDDEPVLVGHIEPMPEQDTPSHSTSCDTNQSLMGVALATPTSCRHIHIPRSYAEAMKLPEAKYWDSATWK
jgi:hypothetical protein